MEIIGEGTRPASPQERELLTQWAVEDFDISASQFQLFCNSALNKYHRSLKKRGSDKSHRHESAELQQIEQLVSLYESGQLDSLTIKIEPIAGNIRHDTVKIKSFKIQDSILQVLASLPKGKKHTPKPGRQRMARRDLFVMQLIPDCQELLNYQHADTELFSFTGMVLSYMGLYDTEIIYKDEYKTAASKFVRNVYDKLK